MRDLSCNIPRPAPALFGAALHVFEMLAGTSLISAGAALGIISGLGQTTSTGTCSAMAEALGIKIGTAMMLLYGVFMLAQLLFPGERLCPGRLLQMVPVVLQGWILNFFKYRFAPFQQLAPESYPQRFVVFAAGMILISMGFTCVKCCRLANYPPEAFCALAADHLHLRFGTSKILLDFAYVAATLLISRQFGLGGGIVREGTLLFALCNGNLINLFQPRAEQLFDRLEAHRFPANG